jgi:hypothetical protein
MAKFQVTPIKPPTSYKTLAPVKDYRLNEFGYWEAIEYVIKDEEVLLKKESN